MDHARLLMPMTVTLLLSLGFGWACAAQPDASLVANGDFEQGTDDLGMPRHWETSGRREIQQTLTLDPGRDGGHAAKLECTAFVGGTPDAHVMLCQLGTVAIDRGHWYRLRFWVKGAGVRKPVGSVAVSNTRPWGPSGVDGQFVAGANWRQVELLCQGTDDVPAATSRLQFWFAGTGTMWFDDIVLEPVDMVETFHPALPVAGLKNFLPNGSFECGSGGWGSFSPRISTWAGNLNQLFGSIDDTTAWHGQRSLRIDLNKSSAPVFHWDYYEALVEPVYTLLCANLGWVPVEPGRPYVFSCHLKSSLSKTPALMLVSQSNGRRIEKSLAVGTQWQPYAMTVTPTSDYLWVAVGIDLSASDLDSASLWIDGVQFEPGAEGTAFEPRTDVESTLETAAAGNIFTDPAAGISFDLNFYNAVGRPAEARGRIVVTDFFDREVLSQDVAQRVPAESPVRTQFSGVLAGRRGFFRIRWEPEGRQTNYAASLRCALIEPCRCADTPFGMNHAYPWDDLLHHCRQAGITWMRDWSAKWQTVEPELGSWDFSRVDPQIDRVLAAQLHTLLLLPFPSALWSSGADMEVIGRHVRQDRYARDRAIVACPARDPRQFRDYVARTVEHFRDRTGWVEIMNEPLYTTYAVPALFGYELRDYLQVLQDAYQSTKAHCPDMQVVGGIGGWVDSHWVQEFIDAGGLKWCDAMDIHLYPVTIDPELYEDELASARRKMEARHEVKPIWLTEFGCYADDDPHRTPGQIGDSAMSRANWPSERAASEALVKTAAVFLFHGIEKIFYHAGTCGPINGASGGGIFFEYGGAPRKMYAAQASLSNQLGTRPTPLSAVSREDGLHAYLFRSGQDVVAIMWATEARPVGMHMTDGLTGYDIMGNQIGGTDWQLDATPVFVRCSDPEPLQQLIR